MYTEWFLVPGIFGEAYIWRHLLFCTETLETSNQETSLNNGGGRFTTDHAIPALRRCLTFSLKKLGGATQEEGVFHTCNSERGKMESGTREGTGGIDPVRRRCAGPPKGEAGPGSRWASVWGRWPKSKLEQFQLFILSATICAALASTRKQIPPPPRRLARP